MANFIFNGSVGQVADKIENNIYINRDKWQQETSTVEVEEMKEESKKGGAEGNSFSEVPESVKACFRIANDYVKEQVEAIVNDFHLGEHVNLAMIEVTLFDHGQLKKRNEHTTFVRALRDWDILSSDVDIAKAASGMASKLRSPFPTEGYKQWDKNYLNERNLCTNIGNRLPVSMKYNR